MTDKIRTSGGNRPLPTFNTISSIAVVVGIIVGSGIFRLPPVVAAYSANGFQFILFWIAGGVISLLGALCYAELSSANPDSGGEYYFLSKSYGRAIGFLFTWGRMTVIQTGSIALVAFILGDYASLILNIGEFSSSIYAALVIIFLSGLNIIGTKHSRRTQLILTSVIVIVLVIISLSALFSVTEESRQSFISSNTTEGLFSGGNAGMAMIFVLLTYGGWNEAAYLSGELINVRKNIIKVLVAGIAVTTILYVLVNLACLKVLGLEEIKNSRTIGSDFTKHIFGKTGSVVVAIIVIISALSTINATILTGARTNYALGRDFKLFRFMGKWNKASNAPVNALIVQGTISLLLVLIGAWSKQAVETLVDYTAPVFWLFLLLTTGSLFLFRRKNKAIIQTYKVPLYPVTPILFLLTCLYMLYSSLVFTGTGALISIAFLMAGIPIYLFTLRFR